MVVVAAKDEELRPARVPVIAPMFASVVSRLLILNQAPETWVHVSSRSLAMARSVVVGHSVHGALSSWVSKRCWRIRRRS